jgi:predicted dehydrogenase
MDKVRWSVVGTGGIGRRTVGDLRLVDTAEVTAVASRRQDAADAFAAEWDIPHAFGEYDELCASSDVDAVYIGTPHSTHFAYAKKALTAGKHVLCEKPLTMTAEEAEELDRIASRNNVFLMEAMWMKFTPAMRHAVEAIKSGVIGDPRFLQAGLGFPVPPDGPRRYWDPELGGGALYDMGIYTVTLAQMIFGPVEQVTASGSMREDGVDLHEAYLIEFAGGATAQLVTAITFFIPPKGWVGGTKGSIAFSEPLWSPRSLSISTGTPPTPPDVEEVQFPTEGAGYVPMFRAVNERILAGETQHPLHPVSATVEALQTIELIRTELIRERDHREL